MYDYMFEWIRKATKEERHCKAMEDYAKKDPVVFMKFHNMTRDIIEKDVDSPEYLKAKEQITELFKEHKEDFKDIFEAVKKMV